MTIESLKEELVNCIHFLHQKGFAPATSSNYSFRVEKKSSFFVSASGLDKGDFSTQDFMEVDQYGIPINDKRRPSAETLLHAMIYEAHPEFHCVLHTHTVYNTVLSQVYNSAGFIRLEGFEVLKGLEGISTHESTVDIPIFENSQNIGELAKEVGAFWKKNPEMKGFLLAGHGLYSWGKDIATAKRQIEVLEFLFEVYYRIQLLNPSKLTSAFAQKTLPITK